LKLLAVLLAVITVAATTAALKLIVELNANLRYAIAGGSLNESAAKYLR
jgi:hypothetical protein